MADLILALDQGTTGTTVALFDRKTAMQGKVTVEFPQIFPKPGWVEHDLEDIWRSTLQGIDACLKEAGVRPADIRAIGITNQRETTGLWERGSGKPVHNAIVWQCRRTAAECRALKEAGHDPLIRKRTGLLLDPYFSGTKLRWLLDHVRGARARAEAGDLCFGTIDSYLMYRLTGGLVHATDVSNASRTLLMDLERRVWDPELLALFGVPKAVLPEIRPSSGLLGVTRGVPGLSDGIPIAGVAGDQQAALFGQACFDQGQLKCTYGTGAFLLMNTGPRPIESRHGLISTVAWQIGEKVTYALEGSVFIAGAAVQWLRDGLKAFQSSPEVEALAASVASSDGVVFVPALAGLGAPHWDPEARGLIAGITRGTTLAHLARATLEGIAFQVRDVVEAMERDLGEQAKFLRVDGGATRNDLLLQFQADLLSSPLHRPRIIETTAMGAALLAGLAVGMWRDQDEIRRLWAIEREFRPSSDPEIVRAHLVRWRAAVLAAQTHAAKRGGG